MKIIKPSYSIYNIPEPTDRNGVLAHLEKIGRTCYKSEDKITPDSAVKFLQNIRNRKHWAMLEHYIFTVSVPIWIYNTLKALYDGAYINNDSEFISKSQFLHITVWNEAPDNKYKYLVSFSATTLNYLINCTTVQNNILGNPVVQLFYFMESKYPEIMLNPIDTVQEYDPRIEFLSRDEIKSLPMWLRDIHDFMSVNFIVDRAVSHEAVRHRPASYAQESTRYCNYSKGKYDNEITVILPSFFDVKSNKTDNVLAYEEWKQSCESSERHYMKLLEYGATPQEARSVLPNSLKTELNMTASIGEFKHFFNMRCEKGAHPQIREVACPLLMEANTENEYYKGSFDENMYLLKDFGGNNNVKP